MINLKQEEMKKILLTSDFSKNANNAIEYAIKMFGTDNAKFTLINTYEEPTSSTNVMISMSERLLVESKAGLETLLLSLRESHPGIVMEGKSLYGGLPVAINNLVKEEHFDFVVLGARGIGKLEKFLMGSNTLNTIKMVKIPTIIVPIHMEYKGLHRIAFAADYENLQQIHLLDPMVEVAKATRAEVDIVNVSKNSAPADFSHAVEGFALHGIMEGVKHYFYTEVNDTVAGGLDVFIEEHRIDLITMVAHKYSFFERLFHRSVTERVTRLAEIPMLILHE